MDTGQDGVYCSTAGAVFQEREALQEHYHSELHRYVYYLRVCITIRFYIHIFNVLLDECGSMSLVT